MRAETERTGTEITTDKILFLVLIWEIQKMGYRVDDLLKAQKLAFLTIYPLFRDRKKAFSLEFFRYEHGPMSIAVYTILDEFTELGLLHRKGSHISPLSKEACDLAVQFSEDILKDNRNSFCMDRISETAKDYGRHTGIGLRKIVYDWKGETIESHQIRKMSDIPAYEHFTKALDMEEAKKSLLIAEDWFDTIDIMLSASKKASIERALGSSFVDEQKVRNALKASV